MPLIRVKTSAPASDRETLLKELSQNLATLLGKPERYVMTLLETKVPIEQHLQIPADRTYPASGDGTATPSDDP